MKKVVLVSIAIFVSVSVLAQDATAPEDANRRSDGLDLPLKAEMTALFTGSVTGLYLSADPSVVWKPGVFAAGIGAELIIGMSQFDVYFTPYIRAELDWFHLDFGYVLAIADPPSGTGLAGLTGGFAIAPKPFALGYGSFGFELAFDWSIEKTITAYTTLAGSNPVQQVLGSLLLSGRIGLGATYAFDLL